MSGLPEWRAKARVWVRRAHPLATVGWAQLATLALFSLIGVAGIRGLFFHFDWLDPWFYTGLIHDYNDIVTRYGPTYYAARIVHIFPATAFEFALGERLGFLAYYYFLLLTCALAVFWLGRRLYGVGVGLAMAAVLCFTPWVQFSLTYDHYEISAFTWLLVAVALALTPTERPRLAHVAGGFALGLASNVNPFVLGIFFFLGPAWLVAHRSRGVIRIGQLTLCGLAGFGAASAFTAVMLRVSHEAWRAGNSTLATILGLLQGGSATWREPLRNVIDMERYYVLTPYILGVLAAALLILARLRRKSGQSLPPDGLLVRDARVAAVVAALFMPLFYLLNHYAFQGGALNLPFYTNYLFIPAALGFGAVLHATIADSRLRYRALVLAALIGGLIAIHALLSASGVVMLDRLNLYHVIIWTVAIAIIVLGAALMRLWPIAGLASAAGTIFLFLLPLQDETTFAGIRRPSLYGWDLRDGSRFLMDVVKEHAPPEIGPRVGFWYPRIDPALNSIQSSHLWAYSMIGPPAGPGMPVIDDKTLEDLARYGAVMVLAASDAEIDAALQTLAPVYGDADEVTLLDRGMFDGDTWDYFYALVMPGFEPAPEPVATERTVGWLDLATMVTYWPPAAIAVENSGVVRIDSATGPGDFSAIIDIPDMLQRPGPGVIRIWISTERGQFSVALTVRGSDAQLLSPQTPAPQTREITLIELPVADLSAPSWVLFANASAVGSSVARIHAIEIALPPQGGLESSGADAPADAL